MEQFQDWISQRGDSFSQNYFNAYPNNIFLTIIFAGIKYLSSLFGCVDNYFPTIVVGVISTDAAIVFTVMTVWKLTHSRKVTFLSIIICTVFLGFNPWIIIPYSDTYVLPFLSAVLYFYCSMKDEKKGYASWIGIVIAGFAGDKNQADGGDCFACNCSGRNIFFAESAKLRKLPQNV